MTESERLSSDELRTLVLFEKLSDDQLTWLADHGRVVEYPAGATIHAEGAPATCFLVLLSGMLALSRRVQGGELELMRSDYRGSYTGAFNFYLVNPNVLDVYPATARAVKDCRLLELPAAELGKALREWFPMASHLLEGFTTQAMENRDTIERHERLVALGSVTAGLTHELHNPVAAVLRASSRLREMLAEMRDKLGLLIQSNLPADKLEAVAALAAQALASSRDAPNLSSMEASDREDEVTDWLTEHGIPEPWEIAPILVAAGLGTDWLEEVLEVTPPPHLDYGLSYPVRAIESNNLLDEITDSVERISGLLASARQYTQMDRAPLQTVDVHELLDATLTMLSHKLGDTVKVVRQYDRSVPQIVAYPGELNQVWTNLIDNAIDAMGDVGTLTLRTWADDDRVVVEVADTGPGVPAEIRSRVFEPFFTTKDIGKGTGLGLDIAWRIVVGRHGGEMSLDSEPGDNRFVVLLPLRPPGTEE
ncbi:MAG TPA: ATP-binding protein [Desertimonas sp.]|nr:ATP-binding protein [Desertimonas sp.]